MLKYFCTYLIQIRSCRASVIVSALTGQAVKKQGKKKLEDRESQEAGFIGRETCHYRSGTVVLQLSSS